MTASVDEPGWARPPLTAAERRIDLGIAVGLLAASALSASLYTVAGFYSEPASAWIAVPWMLLISLPLAVRRRWPVAVAIVIAAVFILGQVLRVSELLVGNISLFLALYTVGAWCANRRVALLSRAGIIGGMFLWLVISLFQTATDPDAMPGFSRAGALSPLVAFALIQILTNVLYFGGAYFFGERGWIAARERASLEERTAELERERERTAAQAVALDRVRIARELHDVVAHHVSVMGIQAAAARLTLDRDPDAARAALSTVEDTSRSAIDELHKMLTTLRETDAAGEPVAESGSAATAASALGVASLPELIGESSATGLPTRFAVVGEPRPLPAVVGVNLYRIAQEALTNARKHAGAGATADVRLRYLDDRVELEVGNTGSVSSRPSTGGLGQIGMRERVAASAGTLEVGPRSRGGYLVRAVIPLTPAPVEARS